ncbi:MAG: hypothetical protein M3Q65_25060 [Chloroflexota bacterium]|nr:hypothetical protein [Chloroflexota bacterium]
MAWAFVDYQRAIVEGQLAEELDALLEEVERAIGDYQALMGPDRLRRLPDPLIERRLFIANQGRQRRKQQQCIDGEYAVPHVSAIGNVRADTINLRRGHLSGIHQR